MNLAERALDPRDLRDLTRLDREVGDPVRLVVEQDVLVVGAPDRVVVEASAAEIEGGQLSETAAIANDELVLAALVVEPGDAFAVVRPGGAAIVQARRLGEVAGIPMFTRNGDDLAAGLEDRPLSVGRDRSAADVSLDLLPAGKRGQAVATDADPEPRGGVLLRIEQVDRPGLLEQFRALETSASFDARLPDHERTWGHRRGPWFAVRPVVVAEVSADQIAGGQFRHGARFERWRSDKPPRECTRDQLQLGTVPFPSA